MTELEKWARVNNCETIEELQDCILSFAGEDGLVKGRTRDFKAKIMAEGIKMFYDGKIQTPSIATREYGIRMQLLYLKFYK